MLLSSINFIFVCQDEESLQGHIGDGNIDRKQEREEDQSKIFLVGEGSKVECSAEENEVASY